MDERDIGQAVDEALQETLEDDYQDAIAQVQKLAERIYAGEADKEEREEFKNCLGELMNGWVTLVVGIFQEIQEVPVSARAIDFYSLMDTNRALIGLPSRADSIIEHIRTSYDGDESTDTIPTTDDDN